MNGTKSKHTAQIPNASGTKRLLPEIGRAEGIDYHRAYKTIIRAHLRIREYETQGNTEES